MQHFIKAVLIFLIAGKVVPRSLKHSNGVNCDSKAALEIQHDPLAVGQNLVITYTYSVTFIVSFHVVKVTRTSFVFM